MLPKVQFKDFIQVYSTQEHSNAALVNIRGCNGSGKSTVPLKMLEQDKYSFEVVWNVEGKERVMATVFPQFNFLALGHYHSKCGGMDSIRTTDEIRLAVDTLWNLNFNILMEGVLASTVRQTYIDLFSRLNKEKPIKRHIIIYNILPPLETCLKRIQERNGGKPIKEELVASKWKTVNNNIKHFQNAGFNSLSVSNENIPIESTLDWFFANINIRPNKSTPSNEETILPRKEQGESTSELIIADKSTLMGYEWYEWYKEPDNTVRTNRKNLEMFWRFIHERLNIYYRRVILGKPAPWTSDKVLSKNRFTNISRDMDKLTIYEIRNIISKLDEPSTDLELRKKSVMFNIFLFRVFVKIESYEAFGFINFSEKSWKQKWRKGKRTLLQRRERGESTFTGSYMVNSLKSCNRDIRTNSNKTFNALCQLEYILNNLDEVYENIILKPRNMKEQLEELCKLPGVGVFNSYEFACSFAITSRYCKNPLVPWTQDNYTNVGPGSNRGANLIFNDFGNLTVLESMIYLRSIWKQEMEHLGIYEDFIEKLPRELDNDLDLRTIEHCLCEFSKYHRCFTEGGRTKKAFEPETTDLSQLIL